MKLCKESLKNKDAWEAAGVTIPLYDCETVKKNTEENPIWLHFGIGNIFRGYIARLQQQLLNIGMAQSGIIAAEAFDTEIVDKICIPYDGLAILATLGADGNIDKEIIASVTESLNAITDTGRLKNIFTDKKLQMVSFTITEKGYTVQNQRGGYLNGLEEGPDNTHNIMGIVTAMMYQRYNAGAWPIALVSMDNCSHNGDKLKSALVQIAELWAKKGYVCEKFIDYLNDASNVAFPWTMIDKITPRPSETIQGMLNESGIEGMGIIVTCKNTYMGPFVNAESAEYLVIEDNFPTGRPMLEKAGVYFTDKETVDKVERMKVTTCLNPLHTTLAIFGCLLGHKSISDAMANPDLNRLVRLIGYKEGLPAVTNPGIINPEDFLSEVLDTRLPNPFIPDTPERIATDTSLKIPIRFGETLKAYVNNPKLDINKLVGIPFTIAGWFRYLLAADDFGSVMEPSTDPMLGELTKILEDIRIGSPDTYKGQIIPLLSNPSIFGIDLCAYGLSEKIEGFFIKMIEKPGAVREVLRGLQ